MRKCDVIIVGGGPAGLMAAKTIAASGYNSVVFEEHSKIGQPIQCGEGISYNALEQFGLLNNQHRFIVKEYNYCDLLFPGNFIIKGDIRAFTINRDSFDQYLAKSAQDKGVEILLSSKITNIKKVQDGYEIEINNSSKCDFFSKFVIIAEGVHAKLAKTLGFVKPSPLIKAFEYQIEGEWANTMEFHFDAEHFPYGYCWIFPKNNLTNIGIVSVAKNRKKHLDTFLKDKKIDGKILHKIGGQIPMHGPVTPLTRDYSLVVGDTAGMVNPIFYGGIRLGMFSGMIAGQIITKNLQRVENKQEINLYEYEQLLQSFPFMKKTNLDCHNFFYSRNNTFLRKLGKTLDGEYINRLKGKKTITTALKILRYPNLYKNPLGLYSFYTGFKIARDWGF